MSTTSRFVGYNTAIACAFGAAGYMGYFDVVWEADVSKISVLIVTLFAVVFAFSCIRLRQIVQGKIPDGKRETFRLRLGSRISFIRKSANYMVLLGLTGTVLGIIIALQGIDSTSVTSASTVAPMVGNLVKGMGIAFYTTLVGTIFHIWTMVNFDYISRVSDKHYLKIHG